MSRKPGELPLSVIRFTGMYKRRKESNYEESSDCRDRSGFGAGARSSADRTARGRARDDRRHGEGRSEEAVHGLHSPRARREGRARSPGRSPLDSRGNFSLPDLSSAKYLVELVNKNGKVVCTEGPFDLTQADAIKNDVVIDCDKIPAAGWLLGAAAAAGITAAVVAPAPVPEAAPAVATFAVAPPASPSR